MGRGRALTYAAERCKPKFPAKSVPSPTRNDGAIFSPTALANETYHKHRLKDAAHKQAPDSIVGAASLR